MKFTPGPWGVRKAANGELCVIREAETNLLAGIAWTGAPSAAFPEVVVEANARLISAAPDLFAALKPIAEINIDAATIAVFGQGFVSLIKEAREAVKKANAQHIVHSK